MFEELKEAALKEATAGEFGATLGKLKGVATGAAGAGVEKAQEMMREFNDTIPTIKALGLSVRHVSFGLGLVPEIAATLVGSVAALDREKIDELLQQHQKNKIAAFILEALKTTSNLKEQLSQFGIRGIKVDLKLGIPPKVEVGLLSEVESTSAA